MKPLTEKDIERLILMAWADTVSFEAIKAEFGLTYDEVKHLMFKHQSRQTYTRWRKRIRARSGDRSKHEAVSRVTSRRQKLDV